MVEYCPTKEMWADIFTKLKQGHEFLFMQSRLLGCPMDQDVTSNSLHHTTQPTIHHVIPTPIPRHIYFMTALSIIR